MKKSGFKKITMSLLSIAAIFQFQFITVSTSDSTVPESATIGTEITSIEPGFQDLAPFNFDGRRCRVACMRVNVSANRYCSVIPSDESRYRLQGFTADGSDYINASIIPSCGGRDTYIATQAPIKSPNRVQISTMDKFCQMIYETKPESLVALGTTQDISVYGTENPRMDVYWDADKVYGNYAIRKVTPHSRMLEGSNNEVEICQLAVIKIGSSDSPVIFTHYYFRDWQCWHTPRPKKLYAIRSIFNDILKEKPAGTGHTTVVHCSSGSGRTGTFLSMFESYKHSVNNMPFNLIDFIRIMRGCRSKMIGNEEQYRFALDFCRNVDRIRTEQVEDEVEKCIICLGELQKGDKIWRSRGCECRVFCHAHCDVHRLSECPGCHKPFVFNTYIY